MARSVRSVVVACTATALLAGAVPSALAASSSGSVTLLVTAKHGKSVHQAVSRNGGNAGRAIDKLGIEAVTVPSGQASSYLKKYRGDADVASVEVQGTRHAASVATDPSYGDQWALPKIGWEDVNGVVSPSGTATLAVLDTGVSASSDVTLVPGWSAFGTDPTDDTNGHGTALASIAAASADDSVGIAGVAFSGVSVMPVQVLGNDGTGSDGDVIDGIVHAADAGADVILMGFSNPGYSQALQDAIGYAWSKGAVLVAATGNDGSTVSTFPAGDAHVVGVSATDSSDALASSSNSGEDAFLGAPGVDIAASGLDGSTRTISGTSASAAIVAGSAALLAAADSSASNGAIVGRLARNADPAGTVSDTGNGRVNLARAIADTSTTEVDPIGTNGAANGGPFVGPYVVAANPQIAVQGQSATAACSGTGTGTWIGGNLANWCELQDIPLRAVITNGPATFPVTVTIPRQKTTGSAVVPGLNDLHGFTDGSGATHTSPVLTVVNADTWTYTFNVTVTGSTGEVDFFTAMRAGAHNLGGSQLKLTGTSTVQIQQPAPAAGANDDLTVTKTGPGTAGPGDTITYSLAYSNKATAPGGATGVQLTDTLPSGVAYVANSCTPSCTVVSNVVTWNLGSLAIGASGTKTLQVTIPANAAYGTQYTNSAHIDSAQTDANLNDNDSSITTTVSFNRAPVAVNDSYSTNEDTALTVAAPGVLSNDTDADGNTLTAIKLTNPAHGTVTLNSNGSFTYTPVANYNGSDSFTYKANDGSTDSNTATVNITVNPVNDAPLAANDSYSTSEDTALTVAVPGVLGNDSDVDGNSLTAVKVTDPAHGTVTLNSDGSFTYTPAANYNGSDSFTYKANDGTTNSNTATVNLTVNAVNDPPVAVADSYVLNEDTPLTTTAPGVLSNDTDVDSVSLTAIKVSNPAHGTVTLNSNGSFTYTPVANYNGSDSFTYKANDGSADSNTVTVSLTVNAVNDAPVAANDSYSTNEDTALTVVAPGVKSNDGDVDGDAITAVKLTDPAHGTVTLNSDGSFSYTPDANYHGPDSFTYKVTDGLADSNTATVSITVTSVNDAPVATNDSYVLNEDTPLTILAPGVLTNDTDADADALTAALVAGPSHGSLTLNSDGSYTYTPAANYNGSDSFTYKANDGTTNSNTATVNLTVNAVNDAPVAANDSTTTAEDTPVTVIAPGVLANDSDVDSSSLTAVKVSDPAHGSVTLNSDGSFTYAPDADYNGSDSFTYKANDGLANSNTATVSITVTAVNDAPVAVDDSYSTDEDVQLVVPVSGVLANDTDVDGDALTAALVAGPSHGSLTLNSDGSFTYTPAANYNGSDSFTYKANDGSADSSTATVSITLNAVNDPPVANDDSYTTPEDTPKTVSAPGVLSNDTDADADALTAALVAGPSHGSLTLNSDGSYTYTPAANYDGSDSFTYKANDGTADSNTATVSLTVTEVNDTPTTAADSKTATEDTPLVFASSTLTTNDSPGPPNESTQTLTVTAVGSPLHGTTGLSSGQVTYTPAANYNGADSFTYTVCDNGTTNGSLDSKCATGTVNVTVTEVNDAPTTTADSTSTAEDVQLVFPAADLAANDSTGPANESGQTLTVTAVTGTASTHGTVSLAAGQVTYTPDADYNGPASFSYTVTDDGTTNGSPDPKTANGTVNVTVTEVNDAPTATDDSKTATEDTPLVFAASTLTSNDSPGPANELQTLTVTSVSATPDTHGTVSLSSGNVTYAPAANYNGPASFSYTVTDDGTTNGSPDPKTANGTVNVTVTEVNDAPTATDDSKTATEDTQLVFPATDLTGNDSTGPANESGQSLTVTTVTATATTHGTVSLSSGNVTYTPAADYNGPASFSYTVTDNGTTNGSADPKSGNGTVNLTVTEVNDAPSAAADSKSTAEDNSLTFAATDLTANDSTGPANESGQTLTVTSVSATASTHGTVSLSSGNVTYAPDADYNGPASFSYTVTDNGTTNGSPDPKSGNGTVNLTVTEVNDAPAATDDGKTTAEDTPLVFAASGLTGNDSTGPTNESSQTLAVTGVGTASHGSVSLSSGNVTYAPAANYFGADSFTYTVCDNGTTNGNLDSRCATGTVNVSVTPVNDVPTATADAKSTAEDTQLVFPATDLTGNDSPGPSNESGQTLTVTAVAATASTHGTVTLASGQVTYTPDADYNGAASFSYTVTDNGTTNGSPDPKSGNGTVNVTVTEVNDAPTAADDSKTTDEDTPLVFAASTLTGNDSTGPANESSQTLTVTSVTPTASTHGTVSLSSGNVTYTPAQDYNGPASFSYQVCDNGTTNGVADSKCASATVNVTVNAVNDAPVASASNGGQSSAQYSDPITPVTITATNDVDSSASDVSASILGWTKGGTSQSGQALGGLSLSPNSGSTFPKSWQLTGRAMVGRGTYVVTVRVTDGQTPTDVPVTIVVSKENAYLEYTGDSFKTTSSTGGTASVSLAAVIREAGAIGAPATTPADTTIGDTLVGKKVTITVLSFTGTVVGTPCSNIVLVAGPNPGTAVTPDGACSKSLPAADPYTVKVELVDNDFYTAEPELGALQVSDPGSGFTTGGGWINEPNLLTKSNFGFTVKVLKNGSIQGNSLYIFRASRDIGNGLGVRDYNFQVKSNSWQGGGLSLNSGCKTTTTPFTNCTATFSGKANIQAIDRLTGISYAIGGGYQFRVDVTDNGEPGSKAAPVADTYGFKVWNGTGTYYQLYAGTPPTSSQFPQLNLNGGNIQVRP